MLANALTAKSPTHVHLIGDREEWWVNEEGT